MFREKTFTVEVEPTVLKWALDSSGWTYGELIKSLKISQNTFSHWLEKKEKPTIKQLETLSKLIKRPLSAFFLPAPPQEKSMPKDYRLLPGKEGQFDKKTVLAIRKARWFQRISKELYNNLESNLESKISYVTTSDNPKKIAELYRSEFNFNENLQEIAKTSRNILNLLRKLIENKNILIFQMSIPIEDARGFVLTDDAPATIVINSQDIAEARIFTLLHEFGHVLLNKSGVSIPENAMYDKNADVVETWCNDFASEFLLPEKTIKSMAPRYEGKFFVSGTLDKLSKKYKLSKSMILYNIHKYGFISDLEYYRIFEQFKSAKQQTGARKKHGKGGIPAYKKCLSEKSAKFIYIVAKNVDRNFITQSKALDYLSIKTKHYNKVYEKATN